MATEIEVPDALIDHGKTGAIEVTVNGQLFELSTSGDGAQELRVLLPPAVANLRCFLMIKSLNHVDDEVRVTTLNGFWLPVASDFSAGVVMDSAFAVLPLWSIPLPGGADDEFCWMPYGFSPLEAIHTQFTFDEPA